MTVNYDNKRYFSLWIEIIGLISCFIYYYRAIHHVCAVLNGTFLKMIF